MHRQEADVVSRRQEAQGRVVQDVFSDAHKVHDLDNSKERSDDQSPTAGSFQEPRRPLLLHDFTEKTKRWITSRTSTGERNAC